MHVQDGAVMEGRFSARFESGSDLGGVCPARRIRL